MTALFGMTTHPGKPSLAGVGVGWPGQDSLVSPHAAVDSIVDKTLFGDRITPVIQFIFQQPPWVMWGGVVLGAIVAFFLLRLLWPRRHGIVTWFRTRSRGVTIAMIGAAAVLVAAAGVGGYEANHFVETDKRFCNGCHIFVPSGQVMPEAPPDSGNYTLVPRLEGKHDTLSCHACHPLKPVKEAVKLVFWMSGIRDKEIPPHAKVPRTICEQCHVQGAAKKTWQAIAATAGHRVHLESDSSAMKDKKECLTCHARTAHRFVPVSKTCGQSGCHEEKDTKIVLGKMATQGDFHCAACHVFTASVPLLATRDSAAGTLRPALQQCFKCHEMKKRLPDFDAAKDPHNGTCGMCHNPHTQKTPAEAKLSCTTAACHADWRKELFHTGAQHKRVAENCLTCHQPHAARVDASDCAGCHERAKVRSDHKLNPPLPFDTTKALRQSMVSPAPVAPAPDAPVERPSKVKGDAPPLSDTPAVAHPPPREAAAVPAQPADTFEHSRHKKLACLTCHETAAPKSKITFQAPRGCQICHHQKPAESDCATCHTRDDLTPDRHVTVVVAAAGKPARSRPVNFAHEKHSKVECLKCHTTAVYLTAVDSVKTCAACHDDHHAAGRDCASCHRTTAITEPHAKPAVAHVKCDACHATAKVASLEPRRTFCLTCHAPEQDHYAPAECTSCHFLTSPGGYRPRLIKSGSAR